MAKYKIIPSSRTIVQSPISIGHKAEKGVEAIEFDLTAWVETYGSGTLTVIMRRWGDAIPYPIALKIDENNKATWTLSDIDTAKAGMAYAQLNYIVGDEVVKKSDIYTFRVMDSLTGEGEPPEAYESWLEHLTHLAAEAMAEVLDIEDIVTDKTLTVDGGIADAKTVGNALSALEDVVTEETDKLKADLEDYNSYNIFDSYGMYRGGTAQGATLTWDNTTHVGTITRVAEASKDTVYGAILGSDSGIPTPLVKGETYILQPDITDDNVRLQLVEYRGSAATYIYVSGLLKYTIPNDIDGLMCRLYVKKEFSGTSTIRVKMLNAPTNKMIVDSIEDNLNKKVTISSNINVTATNQADYPDVDNFPNRTIINIVSTAEVANKPFDSCTIITTGFSTTNIVPYGGSKQIAINNNTCEIAVRSHNGFSWTNWLYKSREFYANPNNFIEIIDIAKTVKNSTVYLESGTYEVFDETHNESYWKNNRPATRYCGINLQNGLKLIGIGHVEINANYVGNDEDIKENFSVFNVAGSGGINNINVEASNICYIVHDDAPIVSSTDNRFVISGCRLIHKGSDHTFTGGAPMCIGAGESNNTYREYINNVFSSTYDRSVNVHTKSAGFGKYIISNNYFINGTLGFTKFGNGTGKIEGIVSNNSLPTNIVNSSDGASNPYAFNNVIRS